MENKQFNNREEYTIDLLYLLKVLVKKVWVLILMGIIAGAIAFGYTSNFVTPMYSSSVLLYVNNSSFSLGSVSISASELSAAQSLVDTYVVILNNRTTMEEVARHAGVDCSAQELMSMVSAAQVNDTEVFRITVTTDDPQKAKIIANSISEVLPGRVADIIDGSSMRIVDTAVVNPNKVSPNITKNTTMGVFLGVLLGAALVVIFMLLDDTIRNEDYLTQNYSFPILAKIPDLASDESQKRGRYYRYRYEQRDQENKR